MSDHLYERIVCEALAQARKHCVGEIQRDRLRAGSCQSDEREQAAITTAQIENSTDRNRQTLEERAFPLAPMRNRVRAGEILQRVLRRAPEVDVRIVHAAPIVDEAARRNKINSETGIISVCY